MLASVLRNLPANAIIVTANERQARFLNSQLIAATTANPLAALPTLYSYNRWLTGLFEQVQYAQPTLKRRLLSAGQVHTLWDAVVDADQTVTLIDRKQSSQLAFDAWRTLSQWQLSLESQSLMLTDDQRRFVSWLDEFNSLCQQQGYQTLETVPDLLMREETLGLLKAQPTFFFGFDDYTPQLTALMSALRQQRWLLEPLMLNPLPSWTKAQQQLEQHGKHLSFETPEQEFLAMATWAKAQSQAQPNARIACVCPHLTDNWLLIKRQFDAACQTEPAIPYNISAGQALALQPVIKTALDLLSLKKNQQDFTVLLTVIRSPFIVSATTEQCQRAQLAAELQQLQLSTLCPELLTALCPRIKTRSPSLQQVLVALLALDWQEPLTASQWATRFSDLLTLFGWPGQRSLNSAEYQAINQWQQVLDTFINLDPLNAPLSYAQALAQLTDHSTQALFQQQTAVDNIQVLGPLEAAGLPFDAVWFCGLSQQRWPSPARPNPFIPFELQSTHAMPHANADRELSFAKQLLCRFTADVPHLIFSHAEVELNNAQQLTPLLKNVPEQAAAEIAPISANDAMQHAEHDNGSTLEVEYYEDTQGMPLADKQRARGGAGLLQRSAACGFKGYAHYRLNAAPLPEAEFAVSPRTHGILLHASLEHLFNELPSQRALLALSPLDRLDLIDDCVNRAINNWQQQAPFYPLQPGFEAFIDLERQKLMTRLSQFLIEEVQRPPFDVIAEELTQDCHIGPLQLTIQVDRIDRLADGSLLIIDYKTGHCSPNDWLGGRPNAPQLPLYALSQSENHEQSASTTPSLSGIAFVELGAQRCGFKGLSNKQDLAIPGIKSDDHWGQYYQTWQNELTRLAENIHRGLAITDPKYGAQTCATCDFSRLCLFRIE